jgi:glutathione-regulated potassium-efflux system ancillary protein KefC
MDPLWIVVAFVLGFAVRQVGLPPLVGFLAAGFVLNGMGVEGGETLEYISDLGVLLLLFSIGVKLRLRSLLSPEVWAGASIHMLVTVVVFGAGIFGLSVIGLGLFAELDFKLSLMIAFALSFSSTVFAVKVLEEKGEMASLHGRVSIGILIMQDVIAVVFLTMSTGKVPSLWALALVALIPLRRVLTAILDRCGHGELMVLLGLLFAFGGARLFDVVGMKPDLGALIAGVLVAGHPKASELAKSLLGFKDLFLVGFFLNIGLSGAPSLGELGIAALLVVAVPFKVALYFLILTRFKLRARTSTLASLSLANYSEFGLIVGALAVSNGWIGGEWLVIIAIALSITFVLASPLNTASHSIYTRLRRSLQRLETEARRPGDEPMDPGGAEIVIFGMGRVGAGAYDYMRERHGDKVIGIDVDEAALAEHRGAGRKVILGDATDADFWERVKLANIRLVMLAMPNQTENMYVTRRLDDMGFSGLIAATAQFDDEVAALREQGVDAAYNFYAEAGAGFAEHVCEQLEAQSTS